MIAITRDVAAKVLEVVDAGLSHGLGEPIPGQMCVEAAVCYALGLPHGDEPECVAQALCSLKIALNDAAWSSPQIRAKGLRRLAVMQLGSRNNLDEVEFAKRLGRLTCTKTVPRVLRLAASMHPQKKHQQALEAAATKCEASVDLNAAREAAREAARYASYASDAASDASDARYAASAAANATANATASAAASAAARDNELAAFAEDVVQILVAMNVPGAQWLSLAPLA